MTNSANREFSKISNLKELLIKRRSKFYEGATLQQHCETFLAMVARGAKVYDFQDTIIVLENYGLPGNVRGWLLFDSFTRNTVRAIKEVSDAFVEGNLYASTHDKRIRDLLLKFSYEQYHQDATDFYLVKRSINHGM